MYNKLLLLFIFISTGIYLNAQPIPVVDLSFDACSVIDSGTIKSNVKVSGNPECVCGLVGDSYEFDGVSDAVYFDSSVNYVFNSDFTIEFYFSVYNTQDIVDIVSFKNECVSDSSFSLQYLPSINQLRFYANHSQFKSIEIDVPLDDSKCWHHIALVRKEYDYFVFLDGKKAGQMMADRLYAFAPDNILSIANNPCVEDAGFNYYRFKGRVDQFKVYDQALNEIVLAEVELPSDMVLNQDTTIYLGDGIQVEMGPTCADNFNWSNKADLDDPDILTPVITPQKSTIYYIYFQMKGKTCYDSLYIHIQDKDALNCKDLLLPNSFTPNGDGLNDLYGISNKFIVDELKSFDIYNRTGTRVFHTDNKNENWDGFYNSKKINPGKYVYKVEYVCKEKQYLKQGIINLLR